MKVTPLEDSHTMFLVESRSLQCPRCSRRYDRWKREAHNLNAGDGCPECGTALAKVLPYQVDLAETFPVGRCACVDGMNRNARARKIPLAERLALDCTAQESLRCAHVREARCFAMNRELGHFEKDRMKNGNGRKEGDAP